MFDEQSSTANPFAQGAIQDSIFWTIYQESMDPILLVGLDNRVLDCNQAAFRQLGLTDKTRLVGCGIGDFSPPTQPDGSDSAVKAAEYAARLSREGSIRFEWMH